MVAPSRVKVTDSHGREFFIGRGANNSWWPLRTKRAETAKARRDFRNGQLNPDLYHGPFLFLAFVAAVRTSYYDLNDPAVKIRCGALFGQCNFGVEATT